jgi:hypothetical protein
MVLRRMCCDLNRRLQERTYLTLYVITGIVLTLNGAAFIFLITGYHVNFAVIFQALGNLVTYVSSSFVPVWVLNQELSIRGIVSQKKTWGLLFCACIAAVAAAISICLLALPQVYQILLVCS